MIQTNRVCHMRRTSRRSDAFPCTVSFDDFYGGQALRERRSASGRPSPLCGLLLFVFVLSCLGGLAGCTETRFLAHVAKKVHPSETASVGAYKVGTPYKIKGKWYTPKEEFRKTETGIASWYGPNFHGQYTANGEIFDQNKLTAAHRTLQLPSVVRVTNLDNGRSLIVRVNDRGPFSRGRILDLSRQGAELLGFREKGTARIKLEVMEEASRYAANEAKMGRSTDGLEIALNKGRAVPTQPAVLAGTTHPYSLPGHKPFPVHANKSATGGGYYSAAGTQVVPASGPSPPAKVVTVNREADLLPVASQLYIQAGAFSSYSNAARLKMNLARLAESEITETSLNGERLYKVRIGPFNDSAQADNVMRNLAGAGYHQALLLQQ